MSGQGRQDFYAKIPRRLLRDRCIRGLAKLVYAGLDAFADEHGECFPSQGRLEEETGLSESTIKRCVKDLESAGWLTVVRRVNRANAYRLTVPQGFPQTPQGFPQTPESDPLNQSKEPIQGTNSPNPRGGEREISNESPISALPLRPAANGHATRSPRETRHPQPGSANGHARQPLPETRRESQDADLEAALTEVTGLDPKGDRRGFDRVLRYCREADPPFLPAEVRQLPQALRDAGMDIVAGTHDKPKFLTLEAVKKWLFRARVKPAKTESQTPQPRGTNGHHGKSRRVNDTTGSAYAALGGVVTAARGEAPAGPPLGGATKT